MSSLDELSEFEESQAYLEYLHNKAVEAAWMQGYIEGSIKEQVHLIQDCLVWLTEKNKNTN